MEGEGERAGMCVRRYAKRRERGCAQRSERARERRRQGAGRPLGISASGRVPPPSQAHVADVARACE
eukprot:3779990-Pleurochrysis_carterae.AAC.1